MNTEQQPAQPVRKRARRSRSAMTLRSTSAMRARLQSIDTGFTIKERLGRNFVSFNGKEVESFLSLRELGAFIRGIETVAY